MNPIFEEIRSYQTNKRAYRPGKFTLEATDGIDSAMSNADLFAYKFKIVLGCEVYVIHPKDVEDVKLNVAMQMSRHLYGFLLSDLRDLNIKLLGEGYYDLSKDVEVIINKIEGK